VTAMRRRVRIRTNRGAKTAAGESRREIAAGGSRRETAAGGSGVEAVAGWRYERGIGARSAAGGMTALSLGRNVRGDRFQMHHYRYCAGDPLKN